MRSHGRWAAVALWAIVLPGRVLAQGVTGGAIAGTVTDPQDRHVPGATVVAVHEPSGSRYEATSRGDGRYAILAARVGGPYAVTATLAGFQPAGRRGVMVTLGVSTDVPLRLGDVAMSEDVVVHASASDVFSPARTGAATTIGRSALATLPTIGDRLNDYARLTPQYVGSPTVGAFAGADSRLNDINVDGASFNSPFFGGQPGDVTGVAPISTEVLEEIQVNVAPYDVRQGNFVGAALNAVTRSGDNRLRASAYYRFRDDGLVGREAGGLSVDPGSFEFERRGGWVSGPVLRDRLAFFLSYEDETLTAPGTTFRARVGEEAVQGNTTRVRASDLESLRDYLRSRFDYDPGPYQDYVHETPATRYLAKLDANVGHRSKLRLRYAHLDSSSDVLVSNDGSLGFGNRRGTSSGLNFQNSNYGIREDIRSVVGEWSWLGGTRHANRFLLGYTANDESRTLRGRLFPTVDILEDGAVYTTFGAEPFTPGNERRYGTLQVQDDFTWSLGRHSVAIGATAEHFGSENVFVQGLQGVYVYNSLSDFYADADDLLANPGRTSSPVNLRRFEVRWSNLPGIDTPVQKLGLWYTGLYAQDEWPVHPRLQLTYGLRVDVPFFADTAVRNPDADLLTFRERDGQPVRYRTGELPRANVLWSPRAGFNWSPRPGRRTQVRGGSGVFTSRPAYVWISGQLGGTGMLTGFQRVENTRARPFDPDPEAYKPAVVNGTPPPSYDLTLVDPGFRFPQVWRSNLAVDQRLPGGIVATLEGLYTREVNGMQFFNANLPAPQTRLLGADARARWTRGAIHPSVTTAIVLANHDEGDAWNLSLSLARAHRAGFLRAAWAAGDARSVSLPGGTALSWRSNPQPGDPNNPGTDYFARSRRAFVAGSHRLEMWKLGGTTVAFFLEGRNDGRGSYTYAGDLNGDGSAVNDLVYVPGDASEMNFQPFVSRGRTFTAAEQAAAWEAYIAQDRYLRSRRGRYAERNGVIFPMVWRLDLSLTQDLVRPSGGRRHALGLRADVQNLTNLLDRDWGVGHRMVTTQPLTSAGVDAEGRATYRLRVLPSNELVSRSFERTATLADIYRVQLSVKYSFE
ncbi:MAG TPA: carboxypeptidase regulatory-like domain-containing protein [Vicinamibacteria bacterium]|nr:carboxypeptidase regulatory-like domain-containing protein [Vicinamibacteria bacterium]